MEENEKSIDILLKTFATDCITIKTTAEWSINFNKTTIIRCFFYLILLVAQA